MGVSRFELELMITTAVTIFLSMFVCSIGADGLLNYVFIVWIVALVIEYLKPDSLERF